MDIRDELITGSYMIGSDGRKEPINWKVYAIQVEEKVMQLEDAKMDLRRQIIILKKRIDEYKLVLTISNNPGKVVEESETKIDEG